MRAPLVLSYVFLCFSYNCIGRYQQIQTNEEKIITFSNFEFFIDLSVGLISFGGHPPELPKPSRTLGKAQNLSFRTRNVTKIIENKSLYSLFIPFGGGAAPGRWRTVEPYQCTVALCREAGGEPPRPLRWRAAGAEVERNIGAGRCWPPRGPLRMLRSVGPFEGLYGALRTPGGPQKG